MKLIIDGTAYAVTAQPSIGERTVRIPLAEAPPSAGTSLTLTADDGMRLQGWTSKDWLRAYLDGTSVVLTQEPTPKPVPTQPTEPQSDPVADLAETVSDLMVEVDKIKLGVTDK